MCEKYAVTLETELQNVQNRWAQTRAEVFDVPSVELVVSCA